MKYLFGFFVLLISFSSQSKTETDDMNKSNNPLTPMLGLNFQDYITPTIFGSNDSANTFFTRGIIPHRAGGSPQIARLTLPYQSVPGGPSQGNVTGFGDLNFFNIYLLKPRAGFEFGVGPYFVFPTATENEVGAGKWQIGASAVAIRPASWGVTGALFTYQHDVAGPSDRPTQNIATLQPFFNYNLANAFYLRSTGIWNFNWQNGDYYIPLGLGLGKIWKTSGGTIINIFAEPQWTAFHQGDGQPNFQVFAGLNLQFPIGH